MAISLSLSTDIMDYLAGHPDSTFMQVRQAIPGSLRRTHEALRALLQVDFIEASGTYPKTYRVRSATYCDFCDEYPEAPGDNYQFCPNCEHIAESMGFDIDRLIAYRQDWSRCQSPPEWRLFGAYLRGGGQRLTLKPQYQVGRYRLDFADPARMLAIEVDGLAYHNGQDSFIRDQRRQRDLQAQGWIVIRFAAKEVLDDPDGCLHEIERLAC